MDRETYAPEDLTYCYEVIRDDSKPCNELQHVDEQVRYNIFTVNHRLEHVCNITTSTHDIVLADGYIMIPNNKDDVAVKYFYDHYVSDCVGVVKYNKDEPCNLIVRLKDDWKKELYASVNY